MYCILVTGIPAAGKSTMADFLAKQLFLPVFSKDRIKELLYDTVGFSSREEKVNLSIAGTRILYDIAKQLMKNGQPFILENNFENASRDGLLTLLEEYACHAITVALTGDYRTIYERFIKRESSPERHRGHVVNDRYPEAIPGHPVPPHSFEGFVAGIKSRGMDRFVANGPRIIVDTTDFDALHPEEILSEIRALIADTACPCPASPSAALRETT